jgi:hypothetical protein
VDTLACIQQQRQRQLQRLQQLGLSVGPMVSPLCLVLVEPRELHHASLEEEQEEQGVHLFVVDLVCLLVCHQAWVDSLLPV